MSIIPPKASQQGAPESERKILPASDPCFQSVFMAMEEGSAVHRIVYDKKGVAIDYELVAANPSFEKHTGIPLAHAVGKLASELYRSPAPPFLEIYAKVAATGEPQVFDSFFAPLDKHFKISVFSPKRDWFVTLFSEVGRLVQQANELRSISRLYLVLSQLNAAILQASSADDLFAEVCAIAVRCGGFKLAWIGQPDPDSQQFIPVASAGDKDGFLSQISIYADNRPEGCGPSGKCFRENRHVVCNNYATDPSTSPWKEAALECGIRSSIALPICRDGSPFAAFTVYSGETDYFRPQEIKLLQEVAASLSFAVDHLEHERERATAEAMLRESESRFRVIFEASRDAILIVNQDGVLDCNAAALDVFGCASKAELTQKPPWEFSPLLQPDGLESIPAAMQRLQAALNQGVQFFEWTHQRANGTTFPAEVSLTRFDFCGQMAIHSVVRDISHRKEAERQLRYLSRAVEQSPATIMITDLDGSIEYVNPKFTALTGFSREEVLGKNPRILNSGKMPAETYADLYRTLEDGEEWRGELLNRKKNGELFWESASISPIFNSEGKMVKYLGVKEDITEKKQHTANIEESENRFRQLTENLESIFWLVDLESRALLYVSPAYEKIWGRTCRSLHQQPETWLRSVHPEDRPRMESIYGRETLNFDETYRIVRPDGAIRWIHDRGFVIANSEGKAYRMGGIAEDITERKQLNEQFLRAQRLESIGALSSGISHDLNNLLAPIMMAASMLRSHSSDPLFLELISTIEDATERGAEIVKQVLTFTRGANERAHSILKPEDLVEQVGRMVNKTFPKSISYRQDLPAGLWAIDADLTQLYQVLLNLCVNARDAMPEGGTLTIAANNTEIDEPCASMTPGAACGPYVTLTVTDTGSGIPQDVLEKMFDPFFTTKNPGEGTGLGLSTVLGIIKDHRGFIQVDSKLGRGTMFQVFIPATNTQPAEPASGPSAELPQGNGACVLLVDDETSILGMMGKVLARNGYQVITAQDGIEALSTFCSHSAQIALVLTDVMMPQMDGVKLTRALLKLNPQLPIIASSGHTEEVRRKELEGLGVKSFLRKPYSSPELLNAVHAALIPAPGPT